MEVFSAAQSKSFSEQRSYQDAQRARVIADATAELLKEKEQAERDFENLLKKRQKEAEIWQEENLQKKKELEKEVLELETRRRDALAPLLVKEEDIQTVEEGLKARDIALSEKETALEEQSRILMRKLDELSTREEDVSQKEARVRRLQEGTDIQRTQVAKDAHRLSEQLAAFQAQVTEKEERFAYAQSELDARKNLIDEKEKSFIEREQEIAASMRLLADQRVLLDKGFEELRRLQHKHGSRN